jgi:NAD(P)H dehydrogenase (quinone)
MTYAVTGSTGGLGALAVQHLLNLKVPASSIVALARDEGKAADLKAKGVQVRIADYENTASVQKALAGVDRLLLVSSSAVGQRFPQHKNVIDAAKAAGVKLLAYTSISHADTTSNVLAPEHKETEAYLKASGLAHVVLRNNWYTENYADDLNRAKETGAIYGAVGTGKVASASRADYAEAAARVLTLDGQAGRIYELSGSHAWDFNELARTAGEVLGRTVTFVSLTSADRHQALLAAGLPEGVAGFVTALDESIAAGSLADARTDLETLLGRKPTPLKDGLKALISR